ncbi:hypothetical protein J2Y45_002481 [Dyadobacter sp. BE34]|uniref:Uncharacterized protein n=1 Tax=Dyadobacter fermentans TaxID=94254 RepID=A0ABU1QY64_9BACT|nr:MULTISPECIES: hypothetical protein [Dyadobacter]MDR6805210.1 hypothetical protein [Dyadobacter fermentans]MDR7043030.1 hypothetical protein [Dyadobacter sp. BE242]MDR7197342.1 hypothetical protein [Dyadobacter sp. BE34]MDR7215224.1 hypothetical protein [Dyadobacter sp. BE31]MDR7262759.1 hypothetical protein [Dyadobacter sp. BE32]
MKNLIAIFISAVFALTSCQQPRKLTPAPETIFDDHGLHVITSFHNDRTRTISVLYGNDEALVHASGERAGTPGVATPGEPSPGELFKLVTWDLKQNPLWFGSDINGGVLSVETVAVSAGKSGPAIDYTIDNPAQKTGKNAVSSNAERISFIFAQRASVFP